MSDFDFSSLDLSNKSKVKTVTADELKDLIKEDIGFFRSRYDSNPDDPSREVIDDERDFYDEEERYLYQDEIETSAYSEEPGVEIIDDLGGDDSASGIDFFGDEENDFEEDEYSLDDLDVGQPRMSESDVDDNSHSNKFPQIPGMEGPFTYPSGKTLYYDPREGQYYDRLTDMYIPNDSEEINRALSEEVISKYSLEERFGVLDKVRSFMEPERRELPQAASKNKELPKAFIAWERSREFGEDARNISLLAKNVLKILGPVNNDIEAMQALSFWLRRSEHGREYSDKSVARIFNDLKRDARES